MVDPEAAARTRAAFNKRFKETFTDVSSIGSVQGHSTGSLWLDWATGCNGWPEGRLIELYGEPSSGKTTIALCSISAIQAAGKAVLYMDYEHTFDPEWARLCGADLSDHHFFLTQPESMERGLAVIEAASKAGIFGLVIVDSLAAMVPAKDLEGELDDAKGSYGTAQARAMSQGLRRLVPEIAKAGMTVIFVNHVHEAIGALGFGPPKKTTPGGKALKFYASIRVETVVVKSVRGPVTNPVTGAKEQGRVASLVKASVPKNKAAPPFRTGYFYLGPKGLEEGRTVLDLGEQMKLVRKAGTRLVLPFDGENGKPVSLAGTDSALTWLAEHPTEYASLRASVSQKLRDGTSSLAAPGLSEDEEEGLSAASLLELDFAPEVDE